MPLFAVRRRLRSLFQGFQKTGMDALLVSCWPNVCYLSGFTGTESWLLVSPKALFFITDSRYSEQAARETSGFKIILRDKRGVAGIAKDLADKNRWRRIGFESEWCTHAFYRKLTSELGERRCVPTSNLVESLRETKDAQEIGKIRQSAAIAVQGFHYVRQIAAPGMTERQLQARLEYFTKCLGAEKPAFELILAQGNHSSMPHYRTSDARLEKNDALLVDMGVVYQGYHSDLTRCIALGKMPFLYKKIHRIVWDAQRRGIRAAGPGVAASRVDAACRGHIEKHGYGRYFGHGTGHGVGLEIHESPTVSAKSGTILRPGMVITVEPGIYLPGKFGVRIEDMVLITEKGNEVLTGDLDQQV